MYRRSLESWAKHWDFILIDAVCLQISFILAYLIRWYSLPVYSSRNAYRTTAIVLFLLGIIVAIFFNTMHNVLKRGLWEELKNTVLQCGLVFAAIVWILFSAKDSSHVSRIVMYLTMGLYAVIGLITRLIYKRILLSHKRRTPKREMVLVGDAKGVERALAAFETHPEESVNVKAVVRVDDPSSSSAGDTEAEKGYIQVEPAHAAEYIRNEWIDEVYVAVADSDLLPETLISQCSEMAVTVHQQLFMGESLNDHQLVERIAKQPVLTTSINIPKARQLLVKRLVDIITGLVLSLLSLITLIICAPFIKIISPGPVLLRYERIGQNGRKFRMYMIRTMYMDAANRPENDRIIKGIGSFLRRCYLDELPKGFNVLTGSMSLVGTRAPSVEEWEKYEYRHRARLACKPGITGLWQVCNTASRAGVKALSFEEATAIDTEYITNWSLGLDLSILLTPGVVRERYAQKVLKGANGQGADK